MRIKMREKQLDKESMKGTIYVLLSAVCFSTGGVLIKSIPWSSITIQGIRSIFSFMLIASYMVITKRKFVWNKTVLFGAICNTVMALTFVSATKMTTAANAIVLQFTEPIFVILLMWILYKKKPKKAAVIACAVVFAGILCFFLDSLSAGGMAGNLLAVFSGFTYALVMMMKGFPGSDFESSLLASHVMSLCIGLPSFLGETDHSAKAWICIILLGVIQFGLSYIFLSRGLDCVSPVTASLTSTLEPILNPILVAIFCGETIGRTAFIGAALVIGAAACYNVYEAAHKDWNHQEKRNHRKK